jgi:hypothetical protein
LRFAVESLESTIVGERFGVKGLEVRTRGVALRGLGLKLAEQEIGFEV